MRETKRKTRRTAWLRTGMILSVLLLLSGVGGVVAKYATEITSEDNTVRAGAFYFTSDLLDGGTHTLAVGTNGTASVTFHLRNHADALRYAEVDITYTVMVTEQNSDGTSAAASQVAVTPENGTMQAGENHDAEITVTGLSAGKTYKIEAQATSPYTATLSATVTVTKLDNEVHYTAKTTGAILEVTVWTLDYEGDITVTYGVGLIPDNTDPKMAGWEAGTGTTTKTVNFEKYTTHTFRFFIVGTDENSTAVTVTKGAN